MSFEIRKARPDDEQQIVALLPRLASFDVPDHRVPEDLWHGDRELIAEWKQGKREDVEVVVAVADDAVVGVAVVRSRKELLSSDPSLHLEVLAINESKEGLGIGSALLREIDGIAQAKGASGISLHVFSDNTRAFALYKRHGYLDEIVRCYKPCRVDAPSM